MKAGGMTVGSVRWETGLGATTVALDMVDAGTTPTLTMAVGPTRVVSGTSDEGESTGGMERLTVARDLSVKGKGREGRRAGRWEVMKCAVFVVLF